MDKEMMNAKVKELKELRRMSEELANAIESVTDAIKAEMTAQGVDTLTGTDWRVTWKDVTSNRLDSAAIKKELPEIAARYTRQTTARRFCVA